MIGGTAIAIVVLLICVAIVRGEDMQGHLRRLIGSNCVLIQRGTIPPYYDCVGCVIEEAAACLDDMRHNRSYNVAGDCRMFAVKQFRDEACCPRFSRKSSRFDLDYIGSAYPETLRCMEKVGCQNTVLYSQLVAECKDQCLRSDPRNGGDVCFARFNSAINLPVSVIGTTLAIISVAALVGLL